MKEELFQELLESIEQGSKIMRGEMEPGRVFKFDLPDIKLIRDKYGLSQDKFA